MLHLLANRYDSLGWAGLLKLENGAGDAFLTSIYDRAAEHRTIFARALLDASEEGFAEAPAASRSRGSDLVARTLAWLEQQEPPEELDDGRWGSWIIEAFDADAAPPISEELRELLLGVDELSRKSSPSGATSDSCIPWQRIAPRRRVQACGS